MEQRPIKRNENIAKLSRDHHASLMFCWKIRQGLKFNVEKERLKNYLEYFSKHHFTEHFSEEENILFAPVSDAKVQKALDDHTQILQEVNSILTEKNPPNSRFSTLAGLVDGHVRYEERVLFPHLEQQLTPGQLEDIGKKLSDTPIKDDYKDDFWIKKAV